tara:strand:+ start:1416 stop:1697 length:282 start_codon:yes stop_codon:yes gene_type:complete
LRVKVYSITPSLLGLAVLQDGDGGRGAALSKHFHYQNEFRAKQNRSTLRTMNISGVAQYLAFGIFVHIGNVASQGIEEQHQLQLVILDESRLL